MKRLFAGIALAALVTSRTMAADMAVKVPPPAPLPDPVFNWSGFYIGGQIGLGWGNFDFRDPYVAANQSIGNVLPGLILGVPLERHFRGDSFLGGLETGVNAQFKSFVVGVEGDINWTDIGGQFRSSTSSFGGLATTSEGVSAKLDWLATLRSRLGWAYDRYMLYGTGGVAFGGVHGAGDITLSIAGVPALSVATSDVKTQVGWTAGAGVEGMITSNWSAKLEYLYTDLGWQKHEGPVTLGGALAPLLTGVPLTAAGDFRVVVQTVKLGLNYRF